MVTSICVAGGAGLIGRRHVQHCIDEVAVELSCIVDPTPAGDAFAREQHLPLFRTVNELIAEIGRGTIRVDGVILATPNSTHVPLGVQFLEAGIPCLVEKPMSVDVPSGRTLVEAEKKSTARTLIGHHRRFNPHVRNMKQLLDSGSIGEVLAVQGVWAALKPLSYFQAPTEWRQSSSTGGGVVLINLVHDIDLLRHFFGNVSRVYCEVGRKVRGFDVEETGALTLRFASGVVGTFVFSDAAAAPNNFEAATGENPLIPRVGEPIYTVLGTRGSFSFPDLQLRHYRSDPTREHAWTDPFIVEPSRAIDPTPPFTHQLRHFVDVINDRDVVPNCTSRDALATMQTLEAIRESIRTGVPVEVEQEI